MWLKTVKVVFCVFTTLFLLAVLQSMLASIATFTGFTFVVTVISGSILCIHYAVKHFHKVIKEYDQPKQ